MSETSQQTEEPELLCDPDCGRHVLFPIKHDDLFEFYKVHLACFWTVEEVDLNEDIAHWRDRLTESERRFVSYVLAFFAASDGVVLENLGTMCEYVRFVADDLLKTLGLPSHYHAKNPFPFMEAISLQGKTNFFERRVSEYQRCGVMAKLRTDLVDDRAFQQDVDF
eukprot:gene785-1256_t